jgi:hypothetical protein
MYNGETVDFGKGNLCANCHQTRPRSYGLELGGADVEINSSHWGPHHGTQANVFAGSGGYEVAGSVAYTNSAHTTVVSDACVTCHLESHNFEADTDACEACHADIEDMDYRGIQAEVGLLFDQLAEHLIELGVLELEDGEYHPHSGVTVTNAQAGALLNFFMIMEEGSFGVHNAKYTKALLTNSIEVF